MAGGSGRLWLGSELMPYYAPQANEDFLSAREGGLDTTPATFGQSVAASFAQGITEMPTARLPLALEHGVQGLTEPDLPVDELNQKYGIKGVLNFDKPMPARTASDLYQEK